LVHSAALGSGQATRLKANYPVLFRGSSPACVVSLLVLAASLAGCEPQGTSTPVAAAPPADSPSEYVIGPGDVLSIFVYEAPPLSVSELPVRPDGRISVPLVPDVMAAGKTPTQLGAEISAKLKKYVNEPNVTVMVRSFQGPADQQVRVIGEATDPQAIPFRANMSVLDVMIATKGLTKFAAGNRAMIVRHIGNKEERIPVHLSDLIKDGDISQNVMMRPGDTLIIPQSYF
jgi:polysaccharide export outer membrane protein